MTFLSVQNRESDEINSQTEVLQQSCLKVLADRGPDQAIFFSWLAYLIQKRAQHCTCVFGDYDDASQACIVCYGTSKSRRRLEGRLEVLSNHQIAEDQPCRKPELLAGQR